MGREQSLSVPAPQGLPALWVVYYRPPPPWGLPPASQPRGLSVLIPALSTHELLSGLIRMMYMKALRKLKVEFQMAS